MARIRTIKPEFWTSEQIVECSTNARLLFIGLWNFSDDAGIHPAKIKRVKMEVFPGDSFSVEEIQDWIKELIDNELIVEYEAEGESYWAVTGWHHQKVERPTFKYPKPNQAAKFDEGSPSKVDEGSTNRVDDHSPNSVCDESAKARRTIAEASPPEGSLREGSLREDKTTSVELVSEPSSPDAGGEGLLEALPGKPTDQTAADPPKQPELPGTPQMADQVRAVFRHWQQARGHPHAKLGDTKSKRYRAIRRRLEDGYTVEQLCQAIDGVAFSPHHRGENEQRTVYDDIELICRDQAHVDRFLALHSQKGSSRRQPSDGQMRRPRRMLGDNRKRLIHGPA